MKVFRTAPLLLALLVASCESKVQEQPFIDPIDAPQALQPMDNCKPCHIGQYDATLTSVMSGYRSISPLMNSLEMAGNYAAQGLLQPGVIPNNLRPRYVTGSADKSDLIGDGGNNISGPAGGESDDIVTNNDARSAFCIGCHNPGLILMGENADTREIPEWPGRSQDFDNDGFNEIGPTRGNGPLLRPLRDYHLVGNKGDVECDISRIHDTCEQVLPSVPGGPPPAGAKPSLGAHAVSCDVCHNARAPAMLRSLQNDGFGNAALELYCADRLENGRCCTQRDPKGACTQTGAGEFTRIKVGPFADAFPVGALPAADENQVFHGSSVNTDEIAYVRSSLFCISCHDVRVPTPNIVAPDRNPDSASGAPNGVGHYRLENLGTEWAVQGYAQPDGNPFGYRVRCQDCHLSLYPYAGAETYTIADPEGGEPLTITSPRPGNGMTDCSDIEMMLINGKQVRMCDGFPVGKAAVADPNGQVTDVTGRDLELPDRRLATHQMTGIDVPLVSDAEMKSRLGPDRPSSCHERDIERGLLSAEDRAYCEDSDEFGMPNSVAQRRKDLLEASARIYLDKTAATAELGENLDVRVTAIALTGHNFPAGFSQERTAWLEVTVTAPCESGCDGDFVLYQSGYQVDKPHPEVNEDDADGSCHDEDLEHLSVIVNPFSHHNEVFEDGPDAGPLERIFDGEQSGLVLFRNELLRFYGPGCYALPDINGDTACRPTGTVLPPLVNCQVVGGECVDMNLVENPMAPGRANTRHPRTGQPLDHFIEEETFSAGAAQGVDNWRALLPLTPRTYNYEVALPSAAELSAVGIELGNDIKVRASINFAHFPPLFLRFLVRTSGALEYELPRDDMKMGGFSDARHNAAVGQKGPSNYDFELVDEKRIDDFVRTVADIAVAEKTVRLQ